MIKAEHIPDDVFWVWSIQWCGYPVGLDTYKEMEAIIKANPKYFPWEAKYNSIPQHVHDAYFNERRNIWDISFHGKYEGGFKGIIPTVLEDEYVMESTKRQSFAETMADLFKMQENNRKAKEEKEKQDKALWDKHYKPYGLEYRK